MYRSNVLSLTILSLSSVFFLLPLNCMSGVIPDSPSSSVQQLPNDESVTGCSEGSANYKETNQCYEIGTTGPCSKATVFVQDNENPGFGICACEYNSKRGCISKPVAVYEDKCFPLFEQGPCKNGEWLIMGKDGKPTCEKTSCTVDAKTNQVDEKYDETRRLLNLPTIVLSNPIGTAPSSNFVFAKDGQCYRTNEKSFCSGENEVAVFLGGSFEAVCRSEKPQDCYTTVEINAP